MPLGAPKGLAAGAGAVDDAWDPEVPAAGVLDGKLNVGFGASDVGAAVDVGFALELVGFEEPSPPNMEPAGFELKSPPDVLLLPVPGNNDCPAGVCAESAGFEPLNNPPADC